MTHPPPTPADFLRQFTALRDHPCPACGKPLRQLVEPRCPHCRRELSLRLADNDPKIASWLAILVPSLMGVGMSLILILTMATGYVPSLSLSPEGFFSSYFLSIPLALFVLSKRQRILQWPRAFKVLAAALATFMFVAPTLAVMFLL